MQKIQLIESWLEKGYSSFFNISSELYSMLICFLHRSILMIMHKVSLEISNSETSHNLKGWPFYTWKDWCFSFSSQSPSLLQDRMGETDIRKFCSKASESFKVLKDLHNIKLKSESDCFSLHQSRWKSDCFKWILPQRKLKSGSDCFKVNFAPK